MTTTSTYKTGTAGLREQWIQYVYELQERICGALETTDEKASFKTDDWKRDEGKGGGGRTRVLSNGNIFEKAGVNTSVVFGEVTDTMRKGLNIEGHKWFACGLSLVLHPVNPFVPTVHANWRYFELYSEEGLVTDRWFGGGTDLTPYYLFEEDAIHFHQTLKDTLTPFGEDLYAQYKQQCDDYFVNQHRNKETRGIGGIFYDHLRAADEAAL
ncbi:MAG: coproporphyrinogen III oxidase, partial [Sediminibacterium sp.]